MDYKLLYLESRKEYFNLKKRNKVFIGGNQNTNLSILIYKNKIPILTKEDEQNLFQSYSSSKNKSCFYQYLNKEINDVNDIFNIFYDNVIVRNNTDLIGIFVLEKNKKEIMIWNVCKVNKSIKNIMSKVLLNIFLSEHYKNFDFKLKVYLDNIKAIKLYEELGFEDIPENSSEQNTTKYMIRKKEKNEKYFTSENTSNNNNDYRIKITFA